MAISSINEARMKKIQLTQGQFALVDDDDFEELSKYKWHAKWCDTTQSYYVGRNKRIDGKFHGVSMHRELLNALRGQYVDHANHDTLDNRRFNLRFCTKAQNNSNRKSLQTNNTSGYQGVTWHWPTQKWLSQIRANRQKRHLGLFETKEAAALAYNEAARELHGQFATLNTIGEPDYALAG